jgi:hypothetical protein
MSPASRWRPFAALPSYFGGKRRLASTIFREVDQVLPRRLWHGLTLVDAFLGGGSVSLWAKAQGFRVLCNDLSDRSRFIAEGLVCNSRTKLGWELVLRALSDQTPGYAAAHLAPETLPLPVALAVDALIRAADGLPGPPEPQARAALLRLLAWKLVDYSRPFGQFGNKVFGEALRDRDFDRLSSLTVIKRAGDALTAPSVLARKGLEELNLGVFAGRAEFRQQDALALVADCRADVLYADPPYTGSTSYEAQYRVLDSLLAGREIELPTSVFNSADGLAALEQLLVAARGRYRLVVLSFGAAAYPPDQILGVAKAVFPAARRIPLRYRWSVANSQGASYDAAEKEVLIVAPGEV